MKTKEEILKTLYNAGHISLDELMILQSNTVNSGVININPLTPYIQPYVIQPAPCNPSYPYYYQITCNTSNG